MKKWFLIANGLALSLSFTAFSQSDFVEYDYVKHPLNITVQLYEVKSHDKNTTDAECQFQLKNAYQFYTNKTKYDLGDTMYIDMKIIYFKEENGINVVKGMGVWHGISPSDGKPFADPTYFYGVGLKNAGEISGVLRDSYCEAKFKGLFTNP